jgi:hypothetical protein
LRKAATAGVESKISPILSVLMSNIRFGSKQSGVVAGAISFSLRARKKIAQPSNSTHKKYRYLSARELFLTNLFFIRLCIFLISILLGNF